MAEVRANWQIRNLPYSNLSEPARLVEFQVIIGVIINILVCEAV
jgi:hypothetical protein